MPFSKSILSDQWLQHIAASNQWQKWAIRINSFWLLGLIDFLSLFFFCACWSEKIRRSMQIKANKRDCSDHRTCLVMFVQPQADKSGTNSSLSTHRIIIDGPCLGLGHSFSPVHDKLQRSECVVLQAAPAALSPYCSIEQRTFRPSAVQRPVRWQRE